MKLDRNEMELTEAEGIEELPHPTPPLPLRISIESRQKGMLGFPSHVCDRISSIVIGLLMVGVINKAGRTGEHPE